MVAGYSYPGKFENLINYSEMKTKLMLFMCKTCRFQVYVRVLWPTDNLLHFNVRREIVSLSLVCKQLIQN